MEIRNTDRLKIPTTEIIGKINHTTETVHVNFSLLYRYGLSDVCFCYSQKIKGK